MRRETPSGSELFQGNGSSGTQKRSRGEFSGYGAPSGEEAEKIVRGVRVSQTALALVVANPYPVHNPYPESKPSPSANPVPDPDPNPLPQLPGENSDPGHSLAPSQQPYAPTCVQRLPAIHADCSVVVEVFRLPLRRCMRSADRSDHRSAYRLASKLTR